MAVIIQGGTGSGYRVAVTPTNRLKVDSAISGIPTVNANITGSITIGSVSATVDSIYIQSGANVSLQYVSIDSDTTGNIVSSSETKIITHNVSAGSEYYLTGFDVTGTADGKYKLKSNTTTFGIYRTNAAQQNIQNRLQYPIKLSTGSILLTVEHEELLSQSFFGTLYGFEK